MELVLARGKFAEAVAMVAGVIPAKPVKEALGFVRIVTTTDQKATIYGTDLEVGIQATVPAEVVQPGEALVPGPKLAAILREIREESVHIKSDTNTAKVKAGFLQYELATGAKDSLPDLAPASKDVCFNIRANDFGGLLDCTTYAAAKDHARYSMMGCHLVTTGGGTNLEAVATDGRRLASAWCPMETASPAAGQLSATVPIRACQMAARLAQACGEEWLELYLWKNGILISSETVSIQSTLVEGRFPDYQAVIPKEWKAQARVQADDLALAIRQAGVMVDQETRRMNFKFMTGQLDLQATTQAAGKSWVKLGLEYSGKTLEIHLNPQYMLDALKHMAGQTVEINLNTEKHPILLGVPNGRASCLVMPLS